MVYMLQHRCFVLFSLKKLAYVCQTNIAEALYLFHGLKQEASGTVLSVGSRLPTSLALTFDDVTCVLMDKTLYFKILWVWLTAVFVHSSRCQF